MNVFENQSSNGDSTVFYHVAQGTEILHAYVEGNLGGGTLTLNAISPNGTTVSVAGAEEITTTGLKLIEAVSFEGFFTLSGSSGADLTVYVENEYDALNRIRDKD